MDQQYNVKIRPILDIYDRISESLKNEAITLPKIVVVGDQSSGKSSVLESITGIDTPRGQNTVTKGPIVIQLRKVENKDEECAFIWSDEIDGKKKTTFDQIGELIRYYQQILTKNQRVEITSTPVHVEVYKMDSPDLTIYDLPGLTYKNAKSTEAIKQIIRKYIAGKETLILLITPANTDFTTSEALSLIHDAENYKERTVAVITKIDLGSDEKNISKKITDNELGLRYPPVVVRNRTQEEIDKGVLWEVVRQREDELLMNHSELSRLPEASKGTRNLIKQLVELQKEKLLSSRFEILTKITSQLKIKELDLVKLPPSISTIVEKQKRFESCVTEYCSLVKSTIKGDQNSTNSKKNLTRNIRNILETHSEDFKKYAMVLLSDAFGEGLEEKIHDTQEFNLKNFMNSKVFKIAMKEHVLESTKNVFDVLDQISLLMKDNLLELAGTPFSPHPELLAAIRENVSNLVDKQTKEVKDFIIEMIDIELSMTYTANNYYYDLFFKLNKVISEKRHELFAKFKKPATELQKNWFSTSLTILNGVQNLKADRIQLKIDPTELAYNIDICDFSIPSNFLFSQKNLNAEQDIDLAVLNLQISCFCYWRVVEKRFMDYFHAKMIKNFVGFFKNKLKTHLCDDLSPIFNESVKSLIFETSSMATERNNLKKSIEDLSRAKTDMESIMN